MSSINKFTLFTLLGFAFLGCTEKKSMNARGMSPSPTSQYGYMGTAERTIDLKLLLSKSKFSSSAVIKAVISLPYDYEQPLQYKWKLGPHVKLEKGYSLTGTIDSFKKDTPVEITLSVDQFKIDSETRFVRFEVVGSAPNKRIFSDGIVSSHQENSFEAIVQEVEKIHAEK